jgi:hypothetical protein
MPLPPEAILRHVHDLSEISWHSLNLPLRNAYMRILILINQYPLWNLLSITGMFKCLLAWVV